MQLKDPWNIELVGNKTKAMTTYKYTFTSYWWNGNGIESDNE